MHHLIYNHSISSIESPLKVIETKTYTYLFFQWERSTLLLIYFPLYELMKHILDYLRFTIITNSPPTPTNNSSIQFRILFPPMAILSLLLYA